jgi:hypothetical protein
MRFAREGGFLGAAEVVMQAGGFVLSHECPLMR